MIRHLFSFAASNAKIEKLIALTGVNLIIPAYHTVSDEPLPHINGLYPVKTVAQFKEEVDFLLKHYRPVSLEDVILYAHEEKEITTPSFLLTFDDGLRQFYDYIAPVLSEKGVPAVCFLNTAFIDNQDMFYRFKAALLSQFEGRIDLERVSEIAGRRIARFKRYLFSLSYAEKEKLDAIAEIVGFSFKEYLAAQQPYLTTEQIKTLLAKGFDFGSHSHTHPEYARLTTEEQIAETVRSLDVLEKFNLKYRTLAFPFTDFGVNFDFFAWAFDVEHPMLDLTFGGAKMKRHWCPLNLPRLPMEYSSQQTEKYLKTEYLLHYFKKIIGKDIQYP